MGLVVSTEESKVYNSYKYLVHTNSDWIDSSPTYSNPEKSSIRTASPPSEQARNQSSNQSDRTSTRCSQRASLKLIPRQPYIVESGTQLAVMAN